MCGIAGEIRPRREFTPAHHVQNFMAETQSRGPDSHGLVGGPGWSLGHNRLSIQDLSSKGHQPLREPELGLTIVYNGEIYNFKELRSDLEKRGYSFFSGADTEVLLKGYHFWGENLLPKLHGMFAFTIYDENSHEVFMARDRLGIKPLYYTEQKGSLFWCSALAPLLKTLSDPPRLSQRALNYYFSFHSVVPAPWTMVEGVFKLPPGHYGRWSANGGLKISRYWNLTYGQLPEQKEWREVDWLENLELHLRTAVRRRLVADVPVGLFLSGGLDSSLIAAFMAQEMNQQLKTYSVGFAGAGGEEGNEFPFSQQVAARYETDHHEFSVGGAELLDNLADCIRHQTEPMVSHDNVGFYLLSKKAAESTKVVQSGQGADEVFAGYHWYPKIHQSKNPVATYQSLFLDRSFTEYQALLAPEHVVQDYASEFVRDHFHQPGADSALDKALRLDTTVMLVDDPVKRVDSNTMAWGLEARVPFLDHDLVEFAATMPADLKLKNDGKGLLKDLGYKYLPRAVIDRPKGYFPVPELKYIGGPFLSLAQDILGSDVARNRKLFKRTELQKYLDHPKEHLTPLNGSKLWQATVLEWWLQLHKIGV